MCKCTKLVFVFELHKKVLYIVILIKKMCKSTKQTDYESIIIKLVIIIDVLINQVDRDSF